ncbi:MAG: S-layer homology domain-containing protein [Candidatus Margulisiibacteriota bacterium]
MFVFTGTALAGISVDPSRSIFAARTLGMGGAHVGLSQDGEGLFINPSALAAAIYPQMTGVSTNILLSETAYTMASIAWPTQWGVFGCGYIGANTGGSYATIRDPASNRVSINPSYEAMSSTNNVLLFTYANELPMKWISVGGNLKFYNQALSGANEFGRGTGMNLDLSATAYPNEWLTLGVNLQNILGGSLAWGGVTDDLGGFTKLGAAMNLFGEKKSLFKNQYDIVAALDIDLPRNVLAENNSMLYHLGLEYTMNEWMQLRAGLNQDSNGSGMTFGVGLKQSAFRFDYAYVQKPGLGADSPHYFSMSYVGDIDIHVRETLNRKAPDIQIVSPMDRYITSEADLTLVADCRAKRIIDKKVTWELPGIRSTSEVYEKVEYEYLDYLAFNNYPIEKRGTIEVSAKLLPLRNVMTFTGYAMPERIQGTAEVRVLLFDPFIDTPMDQWAIRPIALCSTIGLITGYPDRSFKPARGLSRAELVTLLVRTMAVSPEVWSEARFESRFSDVKSNHWALPYINIASQLSIVKGYPNGTFRPSKVVSRAEAVAIITRYSELKNLGEVLPESIFTDIDPNFWAHEYIVAAYKAGMLDHITDPRFFDPHAPIPRDEATYILYKSPPVTQMVNDYWDHGTIKTGGDMPEWLR